MDPLTNQPSTSGHNQANDVCEAVAGTSSDVSGETVSGNKTPDLDSKLPTRLLLVSSRAKNIPAMTRALLSNVIMVHYKYESSSLDGILGLVAQALCSRKVECIGFVFHGSGGNIYICAQGEKVLTAGNIIEQISIREFFCAIVQNHLDLVLVNARLDFLSCPAADVVDGGLIAREIETLFLPHEIPVCISTDLKGDLVRRIGEENEDEILSGGLYLQLDLIYGSAAKCTPHSIAEFERIKVIGKGSFGRAVLCKRKEDSLLVVLKEINLLELKSGEKRQMAMNEVAVLSKLEHPNIISYYDSFEQDGTLVIVMEYADGGSLASYLKAREEKGRPVTEKDALFMFEQIVNAVSYLHEHHILHRDLKSANIFIMKIGIVKVGDFGISKIMSPYTQNRGALTVVGTPYYFSPEICENKPYNQKADIWALGCVLYEIACLGQLAFEGSNIPALANKIKKGQYDQIRGNYSGKFKDLIRDMLQQDPDLRPSANDLLLNVRRLLMRYDKAASDWEDAESGTDADSRMRRKRSVLYWFNPVSYQLTPVDLPVKLRIEQVSLSATHRLVLTAEEPQCLVYAWGQNTHGQLGTGDKINRSLPCLIASLAEMSVTRIAAGDSFSVFCANGMVMTCGSGQFLGRGLTDEPVLKPTLIQNEDLISADIRSVACGPEHTVCVDKKGKVFAWGNGAFGRLGTGLEQHECLPVRVHIPPSYKVRDVRCGIDNTVLIGDGPVILAMGSNVCNKLNLNYRQNLLAQMKITKGGVEKVLVPSPLKAFPSRVVDVSMGPNHTGVLLESGHFHMFGLNADGQLGRGHNKPHGHTLVKSLQDKTVIMVQCGEDYTLAATSENTLYFWGARHRETTDKLTMSDPLPLSIFGARVDYKSTRLEPIVSRNDDEIENLSGDSDVDAGRAESRRPNLPPPLLTKPLSASAPEYQASELVQLISKPIVKRAFGDLEVSPTESTNLPGSCDPLNNTDSSKATSCSGTGDAIADIEKSPEAPFEQQLTPKSQRSWSFRKKKQEAVATIGKSSPCSGEKQHGKDRREWQEFDDDTITQPTQVLRFESRSFAGTQSSISLGSVVVHGREVLVVVETTAPLPKRPTRARINKTKGTLYRKVRSASVSGPSSAVYLGVNVPTNYADSSEMETDDVETKMPTWIQKELSDAEFIPLPPSQSPSPDFSSIHNAQRTLTVPMRVDSASSDDSDRAYRRSMSRSLLVRNQNQKKQRSQSTVSKSRLTLDGEELDRLQKEKEQTAQRLLSLEEEYNKQQRQQEQAKEREQNLQEEISRLRQVLSQQQQQFQDHVDQMQELRLQLAQLQSPFTNGAAHKETPPPQQAAPPSDADLRKKSYAISSQNKSKFCTIL